MSEMISTSDSPNPKLPLDVFHCIVDMLAYLHDMDTLKALSMVCHIFRPLCAKHIYASIRNMIGTNTSTFDQLKTLLEVNPTLVNYMKHLRFSVRKQELQNPNVPIVLNQLQNLDTLIIFNPLNISFSAGWPAIPESIRLALERLISSPHLIHLQIHGLANFPFPWILANSPSLKILHFGRETTLSAAVPPANVSQHATVPQLRALSLSLPCSSRGWKLLFDTKRQDGLPIVDIASLDQLNIIVDDLEVSDRWLGCVQKLRKLVLHVRLSSSHLTFTGGLRFVKHLHPSSLKTLKSLELLFNVSAHDPYSGVCDELELLAAAKCPLESIKLQLESLDNTNFTSNTEIWSRLEDVLDLSTFPTLRDITVHISVNLYGIELQRMRVQLGQIAQVAFKNFALEPSIKFIVTTN